MILFDTDILSTFAKIKSTKLLFHLFGKIQISNGVYLEIKKAHSKGYDHAIDLMDFVKSKEIEVIELSEEEKVASDQFPKSFGPGELGSALIAKFRRAIIATNEKRVINFCERNNILVISLSTILRYLWQRKIVTKDEVKVLIEQIEFKDNLVVTNKEDILED